jgi:hypothetical protein
MLNRVIPRWMGFIDIQARLATSFYRGRQPSLNRRTPRAAERLVVWV